MCMNERKKTKEREMKKGEVRGVPVNRIVPFLFLTILGRACCAVKNAPNEDI